MIRGKRHRNERRIRQHGSVNRPGILDTLIKRPNALEYARFNICWTNRCSVFKSDFVGTTQVIEQSNTADKPNTVLETEEGSIHN